MKEFLTSMALGMGALGILGTVMMFLLRFLNAEQLIFACVFLLLSYVLGEILRDMR